MSLRDEITKVHKEANRAENSRTEILESIARNIDNSYAEKIEQLVGDDIKEQIQNDPMNTIYSRSIYYEKTRFSSYDVSNAEKLPVHISLELGTNYNYVNYNSDEVEVKLQEVYFKSNLVWQFKDYFQMNRHNKRIITYSDKHISSPFFYVKMNKSFLSKPSVEISSTKLGSLMLKNAKKLSQEKIDIEFIIIIRYDYFFTEIKLPFNLNGAIEVKPKWEKIKRNKNTYEYQPRDDSCYLEMKYTYHI